MNKNIIGEKIKRDKDKIIEMYESGKDIQSLANEYNIVVQTLLKKLKLWGVEIKKGDYVKRFKKENPKMELSPELLKRRKENTRINNIKIEYANFKKGKVNGR